MEEQGEWRLGGGRRGVEVGKRRKWSEGWIEEEVGWVEEDVGWVEVERD